MDWIRLIKAILIFGAALLQFLIIIVACNNEDDDEITIACRSIVGLEAVIFLISAIYVLIC